MKRWLATILVLSTLGTVWAKNHAGDIINLSIWKLHIPLDDNGDGVADEVTMPTLRLFEDPAFFHLSESSNSVIFRARCGDPLSEGSKSPRSELQEMKKGGTEFTNWGTNDGKVHNMTISAAFNATPEKNSHVVCARIGGEDDDLLAVRLEGEELLLKRSGTDPVVLDANYELGTFFNLMIIADNGRIRALFERKQVMEWNITKDEISFKAGCQTISMPENGNKPDAFGETEFKSIFITHK